MNKGLVLMLLAVVMAVAGYFTNQIVMYTGIGVFALLLLVFLSTRKKKVKNIPKEEANQAKLEQFREKALDLIGILGGKENIQGMSSCLSRIRITVQDIDEVDPGAIKGLGATGMVMSGNQLQAIFGGDSEPLRQAVEDILRGMDF
ncbi:MAG: PTS transporter subunit EIIB [Turicibacter sp.]|nr:PTS transporter subunit EIIB [Turicibacter sp.]